MSLLLLFAGSSRVSRTGRPPVIQEVHNVQPPKGSAETPAPKGKAEG